MIGLPTVSSSWFLAYPGGRFVRAGSGRCRPSRSAGYQRKPVTCRNCGVEFFGAAQRRACSERCRVALKKRRPSPGRAPQTIQQRQATRYGRLRALGLCTRCGVEPTTWWACEACELRRAAPVPVGPARAPRQPRGSR